MKLLETIIVLRQRVTANVAWNLHHLLLNVAGPYGGMFKTVSTGDHACQGPPAIKLEIFEHRPTRQKHTIVSCMSSVTFVMFISRIPEFRHAKASFRLLITKPPPSRTLKGCDAIRVGPQVSSTARVSMFSCYNFKIRSSLGPHCGTS